MSIRDKLNQSPGAVAAAGIAILIIAGIVIALELRPAKLDPSLPVMAVGKAYFTDDDGATWFIDDKTHLPPFDHNGKTAYGAQLFQVVGSDTPYVAYLETYDPVAKARIEAALKANVPASTAFATTPPDVRKRGATKWVKFGPTSRDYATVVNPAPPKGGEIVGPLKVSTKELK